MLARKQELLSSLKITAEQLFGKNSADYSLADSLIDEVSDFVSKDQVNDVENIKRTLKENCKKFYTNPEGNGARFYCILIELTEHHFVINEVICKYIESLAEHVSIVICLSNLNKYHSINDQAIEEDIDDLMNFVMSIPRSPVEEMLRKVINNNKRNEYKILLNGIALIWRIIKYSFHQRAEFLKILKNELDVDLKTRSHQLNFLQVCFILLGQSNPELFCVKHKVDNVVNFELKVLFKNYLLEEIQETSIKQIDHFLQNKLGFLWMMREEQDRVHFIKNWQDSIFTCTKMTNNLQMAVEIFVSPEKAAYFYELQRYGSNLQAYKEKNNEIEAIIPLGYQQVWHQTINKLINEQENLKDLFVKFCKNSKNNKLFLKSKNNFVECLTQFERDLEDIKKTINLMNGKYENKIHNIKESDLCLAFVTQINQYNDFKARLFSLQERDVFSKFKRMGEDIDALEDKLTKANEREECLFRQFSYPASYKKVTEYKQNLNTIDQIKSLFADYAGIGRIGSTLLHPCRRFRAEAKQLMNDLDRPAQNDSEKLEKARHEILMVQNKLLATDKKRLDTRSSFFRRMHFALELIDQTMQKNKVSPILPMVSP